MRPLSRCAHRGRVRTYTVRSLPAWIYNQVISYSYFVTLPPYTSHKLEPLDKTVFGPFTYFFNLGANAWMLSHPGQTLTIYDVSAIAHTVWDMGATPVKIQSGCRCTGIFPFDK